MLGLEQQVDLMRLLRAAGAEKMNFAGGEPFLHAKRLGDLLVAAKDAGYATSIISNGSLIEREWLVKHRSSLDILGLSVDTLFSDVNFTHGRWTRGAPPPDPLAPNLHLAKMRRVASWCHELGIKLKVRARAGRYLSLFQTGFISSVYCPHLRVGGDAHRHA